MKTYTRVLVVGLLALLSVACAHLPFGHRDDGGAAAPPAAAAQADNAQVAAPAAVSPASPAPPAARAEAAAASGHIELRYAFKTQAAPDRVYAAITGPARWWDDSHTYSGSAANLSLDAHAGGCWCEQLADGGSVQHMSVLAAMPGRMLRLAGGLGPLQAAAVDAVMTWTIRRDGAGSALEMTYVVAGYYPGGLEQVRGDVDAVLAQQVERLRAYLGGH